MPIDKINGLNIYWEMTGPEKQPVLVLVHGSWGDHHNWDRVIPGLSNTFRVITYDRRGHSKSERPSAQGTMEEDIDDLLALIDFIGIAPVHLVGNSGGAAISLKTALKKPAAVKTLLIHEPPLFGVLKSNPEAQQMLEVVNTRIAAVLNLLRTGENEQAARQFVETIAFGPGAWAQLPLEAQLTFIYNAPTFLDENGDAAGFDIDLDSLRKFRKPSLLSGGTESAPFFLMVLDQLQQHLPSCTRMTFENAGHVPHITDPQQYVKTLTAFCLANENVIV
jgi:pimeloyl-ACP methyl ester carboxylesterase